MAKLLISALQHSESLQTIKHRDVWVEYGNSPFSHNKECGGL